MKKNRILSSLLTLLLLSSIVLPFSSSAANTPQVTAQRAILVDANYDEVLFEKQAHQKAAPASITKVMTALLVCEALEEGTLTEEMVITASETAFLNLHANGSTANIKPGEEIDVRNLLYCLLLPSANEAANILAEAVCGNIPDFVEKMNQRAQELGCSNTHFANVHGLDQEGHYTTAYDIYLFTKEAMTHPLFQEIVSTKVYDMPSTNISKARRFYNTNSLLSTWYYLGYTYEKAIGVKTGTTDNAGCCLVSAAKDGDDYLICVVLGAEVVKIDNKSVPRQFSESRDLLKWGFENFRRVTISRSDTPVTQVAVTLSEDADYVMLKPVGEISCTLPVDISPDDIQPNIELFQESIEAPVEEGQILGTMTMSYGGKVYGTLDLVTTNSVERSDFLYRKAQVMDFFSQSGTKLILAIVGILAASVLLKVFVFTKRRRPAKRHHYSGRRRY